MTTRSAQPVPPPFDMDELIELRHELKRTRAALRNTRIAPHATTEHDELFDELPARVREAMMLMARGYTVTDAAESMGISADAVKRYTNTARERVDATSTLQALVRYGVLVIHPDLRDPIVDGDTI